MPVYTPDTLSPLIKAAEKEPSQVYLFIGDRFLCRQAADDVEKALLKTGGTVHHIDGEEEHPDKTLSKLRSFSLLPGRQIYRVNDTRLFHSKKVGESLWNRALKAKNENRMEGAGRNLLALLAAGGLDPGNPENDPSELRENEWKKCFDFAHPGGDLAWTTALMSELRDSGNAILPPAVEDPAILLQKTLEQGLPKNNLLLLLAEEVDKRKRLYKYLKETQSIIDLSIEQGASSRAKNAQKSVLQDLVNSTLKAMNKNMAPGVMEQLLERVGFHPVAVVMETEKLCLSTEKRSLITREDLNAVVGRTRQEALFELTGAIGNKQLAQALILCTRLVGNAVHPLAIVATLRNHVRTLLLFRSLLEQTAYGFTIGMQANIFQKHCLPKLKEQNRWKQEISGHPYAVFMQFTTASSFSLQVLTNWMQLILQAEQRLKGTPLEPLTILHHLLITMLTPAEP